MATPRINRKLPAPAMINITSSDIPPVLDALPSASAAVVGLIVGMGVPKEGDAVGPVGASVVTVGAGVDPVGADVDPVGAGVDPVGAGVEPVGADVDPVGAGVGCVGAGVGWVGAGVGCVGAGVGCVGAGVGCVGAGVVEEGAKPQSKVEKRLARLFSPTCRSLSSFGVSHNSQCPGSVLENVK